MAGGKLSPRQKMINLMYLIFIAMLALNMSKEVLAAFGLMNEKLEASNVKATESNTAFLASLETKAGEDAAKYAKLHEDAKKIKQLSSDYYNYLENLKKEMVKEIEDPKDYQVMDKSDYLDQKLFQGDNLAPEGKKFLQNLKSYRDQVLAILGEDFQEVKSSVTARFQTGDKNGKVERRDGVKVDWINYNYEGFPLIASLTKITALQSDIKATEEGALKAMLQGELTDQVSLSNFSTLLEQEKSAFYSGERFSGSIVLGKTDKSAKPVKAQLTLDGRKLTEGRDYELQEGGVKMLIGAGNPGDHTIAGSLFYMQDGEEKEVPVKNSFSTISKPNAALISADKMNVVYRG
ncbi:MAG: gliding motility protein GldM, partial [Bacteroidota bacterium]